MPLVQPADGHVGGRPPRGQDEIDLVLQHQPLGETNGLLELAAIVIYDEFDRHPLVVLGQVDAAGFVNVMQP